MEVLGLAEYMAIAQEAVPGLQTLLVAEPCTALVVAVVDSSRTPVGSLCRPEQASVKASAAVELAAVGMCRHAADVSVTETEVLVA